MATSSIALDPAQYVRVNNGLNPLLIQSLRDDVKIVFSDEKPAFSNSVFHPLGGNDDILRIDGSDTNVWALPTSNRCGLVVTEFADSANNNIGIVDTNNTDRTPDITPPTDSNPYIGDWSLNDGFNAVQVTMSANGAGRLYFDFYDQYDTPTSGSSPTSTFPSVGFEYDGSGFNEFHQAVKGIRWFRVRFVPDDASITSFRINTYFLKNLNPANIPANQPLAPDQDGSFVRTSITQDEISIGLRSGVRQFNKFAYRTSTAAAAGEQTIWATTTNLVIMKTAETFTIQYNNVTDGALSVTGATVLLIDYLDANEKMAQATHVLGSTGADVTAFSGFGINRIVVVASGTNDTNINDITVINTVSLNTQAVVPANVGVTQQLFFFAPNDAKPVTKLLFLNCNKISGGSSPRVTFKGYVYNRTVDSTFEIFRYTMDTGVENKLSIEDPCNFPLSARDVIYFTMDVDTNNTVAAGRFSMNLYDND